MPGRNIVGRSTVEQDELAGVGLRVLKCQSGSRAPTVVFLHRMVSDKSWF